ncbi:MULTISPECIES: PIG-L deacetylase family protein [Clostridium]|uniref:PIG-L deacetylase family protein n=1 Tax=Clostridium TaxID=1485 RepID=UPI000423E6C2|nr:MULTISPECIES: PIG-L family deacetylase [Clostridium]MDU4586274.1 PIG-L family deacetylase [Clostridium sp.]
MKCKKVLVISVHPDDETIGCGGTLLKHKKCGDELYWLLITNTKSEYGYTKKEIEDDEKQINAISKLYEFRETFKLGFKPANLDNEIFGEIVTSITDVVNKLKPEIVYMVNRSDIHTDHQIASKAIISSTKSFRHPYIKRILMYECLSETEISPQFQENIFIPNVFSDISEYMDDKLKLLSIYETELQEIPLPRNKESILALGRYRGCSACVKYAEAFMLVRDIM